VFDRQTQYGTDTMSRGAANAQAITMPFDERVSPEVFESYGAEYDTMDTETHPATGGNPVSFLFILLGLIVAMFLVHRSSPVLERETFGVNWASFVQVGVMATFFILLLKAIFGRYNVRGITPAVAAI
jgi:hypothetical protein